jgi:peptidoglycan/xylan/chitin deacetylase (PgdA/CDA1 family)
MTHQITIVMYHYVRPIKYSSWPEIKGLELEGFRRQLDYLLANFKIISAEDVIHAVKFDNTLPKDSCWLTFDDGYKDHFSYVLPELIKRKIQGSFFPPVKPITERLMLDVNSIHHILASTKDVSLLVNDLNNLIREHGYGESDLEGFWSEYAVASRYDTKDVIYVKRLLQHALPEVTRHEITSSLFEKYVNLSQEDFAEELYMSEVEVKKLVNSGMFVGSHGYSHLWLNREDKDSQRFEIERSLEFLKGVGARTEDWVMCYPYGAYNNDTLEILGTAKCSVGLTTKVGKADISEHNSLELPRFDTNDFPQ